MQKPFYYGPARLLLQLQQIRFLPCRGNISFKVEGPDLFTFKEILEVDCCSGVQNFNAVFRRSIFPFHHQQFIKSQQRGDPAPQSGTQFGRSPANCSHRDSARRQRGGPGGCRVQPGHRQARREGREEEEEPLFVL